MSEKPMMLLGDEAIAQGALDAGISGVYAYPGTPSTEITEYIQASPEGRSGEVHSQWSANEKTAVEAALGMSYAGKRALSCMKHVGLNVAADPFVNAGVTGANGGLVVVSADDPSMHSSQNEQDSRFYGSFSFIPTLEPGNQQEAYDMVRYGYELSEKYHTAVLLRITTRLAHSRSGVTRAATQARGQVRLPEDKRQFVLLPAIARRRYQGVLDRQPALQQEGRISGWNVLEDGPDKSLGIIACGIGYNYLMEACQGTCPHPVLRIRQYPVDPAMVAELVDACQAVLVLEEGMPLVEEQLRGLLNRSGEVRGRLSGHLPRTGELNPNAVAKALGRNMPAGPAVPELVQGRPPALCQGCSHVDAYLAINEAIKDAYGDGHVFADIGCYTLGALAPFESINSCVDMGASITMAKGAADAGLYPSVAVIGDSTFCHSGMTGLLDAVIENTRMIVFIMDNSTTGMTGGQDSHALGRLEQICAGLGVEPAHIRTINPIKKNHEAFVALIKEELAHTGVSVIIPRRECMQTLRRKNKK